MEWGVLSVERGEPGSRSVTLMALPSSSSAGSGAPATRAPTASPLTCWTVSSSSPPPPTARKTQSRSFASGAGRGPWPSRAGPGCRPEGLVSILLDTWGPLRSAGEVSGPARSRAGRGILAVASGGGARGFLDKGGAVRVPGAGERALKGGGSGGPSLRSSSCLSGLSHSVFWASEDSDSSWLRPWLNTPAPPCPQVRGRRRRDE